VTRSSGLHASRSESGFAVIEVIVSAAVLAIVALAVLSGMDGASFSSAREKARAVAGSLAERKRKRSSYQ
jgi:type II secretory pathway pseudopilin PulG